MQSRRNFLKLLGLGTAAATIPTAATTPTAALAQSTKPTPLPTQLSKPTLEILEGTHLYIHNPTQSSIRIIRGPWTGQLAPNEIPLIYQDRRHKHLEKPINSPQTEYSQDPPPLQISRKIQKLINRHARLQVKAMNGDPFGPNFTKADNARHWQTQADFVAQNIEEYATLHGHTTTWPGIYPEFTPINNPTQQPNQTKT